MFDRFFGQSWKQHRFDGGGGSRDTTDRRLQELTVAATESTGTSATGQITLSFQCGFARPRQCLSKKSLANVRHWSTMCRTSTFRVSALPWVLWVGCGRVPPSGTSPCLARRWLVGPRGNTVSPGLLMCVSPSDWSTALRIGTMWRGRCCSLFKRYCGHGRLLALSVDRITVNRTD
jgi:hypothetical protein